MITLQLIHTSYSAVLQSLSQQLNSEVRDGYLYLPSTVGEGYLQVVELPNGLEALLSDIRYKTDVTYKREKTIWHIFEI